MLSPLTCNNHATGSKPESFNRKAYFLVPLQIAVVRVHRKEKTMEEELLTVREVAKRLRVDDTTVRRWIQSGVLEAIPLPHKGKRMQYRIRKSALDAILKPIQPGQQDTRNPLYRH